MRRRFVICGIGVIAIAVLLVAAAAIGKSPLTLTHISTAPPIDGTYFQVKFCLSNCSSRAWIYRDSSIPDRLWRVNVKIGEKWKEGHLHRGYAQTIGWDRPVRLGPGESREIYIGLPADGVERRVGALVQLGGVRRNLKSALFVRDWYYRLFRRTLTLPGEICVWSQESFSSRAMIDRGLLATNLNTRVPFDSALWKSGNAETKFGMVRDLELTRVLIGASGTEVQKILQLPYGFQSDHGYAPLGFLQTNSLSFPDKFVWSVELNAGGRVSKAHVTESY